MFSSKKDKMLVVAIDLGTTSSCYAFSLKNQYEQNPTRISLNSCWNAGSTGLLSLKAPTVVLFDKSKKFHSFGYEAENKYAELVENDEHHDWFFFKRFKMKLHGMKIRRDIVIQDDTGKGMEAKVVFGAAIRYLKDHMLNKLEQTFPIEIKDIHWVLTVPAIWTDSAKQFMRESANEAGIHGNLLSIVRESEAASIFCQVPPSKQSTGSSKRAKFTLISPGTKFMVINLESETVDISVHEKQSDGGIREVHKATGGAYGGTKVKEEFYQLIIRLIGAPAFQQFCGECMEDYQDLQREIETKVRYEKPDSRDKITVKVPVTLLKIYRKVTKEKVQDAIEASLRYKGKITWEKDKMRMNAEIFKGMFKVCSDKLVSHIKDLLQNPEVQGTDTFLMVGEFSESDMMQHAITEAFPNVKVVIPEQAGLAVIKGAVIFGHEPLHNRIIERKSNYSNTNIFPPFNPANHLADHRFSDGGNALVVAIDFGTTFSGYAFSFKHEYDENPTAVKVNQTGWNAGSRGLISLKAPTVVLFDKSKKFHSFGYEAENKYSDLAEDDKHREWYIFKRFKMKLHGKKKRRDIVIADETGKEMGAKVVFGAAIKYLKDHLLNLLKTRGTEVDINNIHWVLTVPAIWTDSAKQFMRESANEACIDDSLLSIALEPEAASIFCQAPPSDQSIKSSERAKFALIRPGTKYMVVDLGGGTADITVHEKQPDGGLREVHKATGGAWGGTKVDEEFYQLIIRLIGGPAFQTFRDKNMADFQDLQREFETTKRTVKPDSSEKITIKVPVSLSKSYRNFAKEEVKDAIEASRYKGKMTWRADKMRIDAEIFKSMFKVCSDKLVSHITDLLKNPEVQGTDTFLMVGGFSESDMMQHAITTAFPNVKVVIPEDAGLTVVKGAVIFGHKPLHNTIVARKSKYTYGINISPPFDPSIHRVDHRVSVGGVDRCRDVFKKYIHEGETIPVNEPRTGKHVTLKPHQKEMLLKIFATEKPNPTYVDEDDDIEYIGPLIVKLPDTDEKIRVQVSMKFGETELMVEAEELLHHKTFTAYFDFC